jgi:hypothetical protein
MKLGIGIVVVVLACSGPTAPRTHGKPTAPVAIELAQRALGGNDYEITMTARPTANVDALELVIEGRTTRLGASRAGVARTATARVHLVGSGRSVVASAATIVRGQRRNAAASITIGSEPVQARLPSRFIVMPDGTVVDEVRP